MAKYKFSKDSLEKLNQCDFRLKALALLMMAKQEMDFSVICGYRNEKEQTDAFFAGSSKVKFPLSKHNALPSLAYDRVPYPIPLNALGEWDANHPAWNELKELENRCAKELGIEVFNSISWDKPHCELKGE